MSLRKIIGLASFAALGAITVYGMGCSSSTNSGSGNGPQDSGPAKDTGTTKTDSSVADTGGGGDSGGGDAGGDSGGTCPDNTPFMAITWAPPTPFHQGVCTSAQTSAYSASLNTMAGPFTSGNAGCDACIQTLDTAAKHGPIVSTTQMGMVIPTELNIGGCLAIETGAAADAAKGGCGNQLNNANDCITDECGDCMDASNPAKGGPFDLCDQAVLGMGGVCATDGVTMACDAELTADSGVQICLNSTLVELLNIWCGSGSAPADGGADSGTPPGDAAGGG